MRAAEFRNFRLAVRDERFANVSKGGWTVEEEKKPNGKTSPRLMTVNRRKRYPFKRRQNILLLRVRRNEKPNAITRIFKLLRFCPNACVGFFFYTLRASELFFYSRGEFRASGTLEMRSRGEKKRQKTIVRVSKKDYPIIAQNRFPWATIRIVACRYLIFPIFHPRRWPIPVT